MRLDPNAPDETPPPRQVEPWTNVPGHEVIARPGRAAFCSCGQRQALDAGDVSASAVAAWRTEHLRTAWPVLVERVPGETLEDWMGRISREYVAASSVELDLAQAAGLADAVPPGGKFPLMTEEFMAASDRVEVVGHQLEEVRTKVLKRQGLDS